MLNTSGSREIDCFVAVMLPLRPSPSACGIRWSCRFRATVQLRGVCDSISHRLPRSSLAPPPPSLERLPSREPALRRLEVLTPRTAASTAPLPSRSIGRPVRASAGIAGPAGSRPSPLRAQQSSRSAQAEPSHTAGNWLDHSIGRVRNCGNEPSPVPRS